MLAAAITESWLELPEEWITDIKAESRRFQRSIFAVCNAAMPIRRKCTGRRRRSPGWQHLSRARRKRLRVVEREERLEAAYRTASPAPLRMLRRVRRKILLELSTKIPEDVRIN